MLTKNIQWNIQKYLDFPVKIVLFSGNADHAEHLHCKPGRVRHPPLLLLHAPHPGWHPHQLLDFWNRLCEFFIAKLFMSSNVISQSYSCSLSLFCFIFSLSHPPLLLLHAPNPGWHPDQLLNFWNRLCESVMALFFNTSNVFLMENHVQFIYQTMYTIKVW